jgi:hypothetical protein
MSSLLLDGEAAFDPKRTVAKLKIRAPLDVYANSLPTSNFVEQIGAVVSANISVCLWRTVNFR